jgi:hypothetical protein
MSNKPILPNAYVDINTRNLGLSPTTPSGIAGFVGYAEEGSATPNARVAVNTPNEVKDLLGFGELPDEILNHMANGGKKVYAVPVPISTESTIGSVTDVRVGTSDGTVAVAKDGTKKVTNDFNLKILITKTGLIGVAKFQVSTDGGVNYDPSIVMTATYVIPGTNLKLTFTDGTFGFDEGDYFTCDASKPAISKAEIETAVDVLIGDADISFDDIVITSDADAALITSLKAKAAAAEGSPNFKFTFFLVKPLLSTSASQAITQASTLVSTIVGDRILIVTGEAVTLRTNHADQRDRSVIGCISGRRSSLGISEDVGLFSGGALNNILSLRTGWTETTIEELDALRTVTIRNFKGTAGFRPTNGWMSDPFSDVKKSAWRLVLDKACRRTRLAALGFVKVKVNPADIEGSTRALKEAMQAELNLMAGNEEIVDGSVVIPEGQDILTTEEIKADISIIPFGHASFIGITIGFINPLRVA